VTRLLAWIAAALAAVVVATGVYGAFRYRPNASGLALATQRVHPVAGFALAGVVVLGLVVVIWERRPDRRHGLPAFAGVAVIGVLLVIEVVIGSAIKWDQVALWAVTVGSGIRGVVLRDVAVKFVIVDGRELGWGEFRRLVWLHLLVLPGLIAAGAGFVVWWVRRQGAGHPSGE
jgi:hypothetical protein